MKFEIDINDDIAMDIVVKSMDLTIECARTTIAKDQDSKVVFLAAKIIRDWYTRPK